MHWKAWVYLVLIILLGVIFGSLIIYYFSPSRENQVERPKYRMLEEEENDAEE